MKVRVHPADQGACGHYRLIFPAKALIDQGEDVHLEYKRAYKAFHMPTAWGADRAVGLAEHVDADVVVLQRPLARERAELVRLLQDQGVAVVVEIDDAFHAIHRRNPAWKRSNPLHDPDHNRDWLRRACDAADLVTVTTPELARAYGRHGRVMVLPNYVPAAYCTTEPGAYTAQHLAELTGTVVGWTGSTHTHPDDLQVTGGGVATVLDTAPDAFGARFHVVGTGQGVQEALALADPPTATGWLPLDAYPEAIRQIDVGIVPLATHVFNEAKSWLKGLEFAALGVPFVASATGPYRELTVRYELGLLASEPCEWARQLLRLMDDCVYREETALRYRATVAEHLTVEGNAWRWMEAWALAVEHRKKAAA